VKIDDRIFFADIYSKMMKLVPQQFIKHPNPQQIKFSHEILIGRHEVAVEIDIDVLTFLDMEYLHVLDVLKVCIDRHV
jgi:hypothetical protein